MADSGGTPNLLGQRIIMPAPKNTPASESNIPWAAHWQPSSRQVRQLEADLIEFMSQQSRSKMLTAPLANYGMQFVGVSRNNRPHIYVNAFCHDLGMSSQKLQEHLVMVLDGGGCFFNVLYDPEARAFSDLAFNGVA